MLIGDSLRNSAQRAPGRVALIGRGRRVSYAEFDKEANRLANALLDLGLGKGAKVAILSTNCPEYAIAYFAIARTPYISAHCSTRSIAGDLTYVLNKIEAEVLLFESAFGPVITEAMAGFDKAPGLIVFDRKNPMPEILGEVATLDEFVAGKAAEAPKIVQDENDGLAITLTGGTTGLPKAVLVSHKARWASAVASAEEFGLGGNDIVVASTPLFHTAGLFVWFGTAVMVGSTVVFPDAWDPVAFMQLVEQEQVTAAFLVPSQEVFGQTIKNPVQHRLRRRADGARVVRTYPYGLAACLLHRELRPVRSLPDHHPL
jgi:acyl-CoA synthetase (AMP-forming)/AMP-acid ligase II